MTAVRSGFAIPSNSGGKSQRPESIPTWVLESYLKGDDIPQPLKDYIRRVLNVRRTRTSGERVMPCGRYKGELVENIPTLELEKILEWYPDMAVATKDRIGSIISSRKELEPSHYDSGAAVVKVIVTIIFCVLVGTVVYGFASGNYQRQAAREAAAERRAQERLRQYYNSQPPLSEEDWQLMEEEHNRAMQELYRDAPIGRTRGGDTF